MGYESPDSTAKFSPRDNPSWINRLFLIYPTSYEVVNFTNDKGEPDPTDVVTADVAILDLVDPETQKPTVVLGARIAGKAIAPRIKSKVGTGNAVLGRLRQLPAQGAKSGAYVIDNEFTPQDEALAKNQDAQDWRGKYGTATPHVTVGHPLPVLAPPTGAASSAPATGAPWFATDTALLTKLLTNGVANATTLDHATAQLIGASL